MITSYWTRISTQRLRRRRALALTSGSAVAAAFLAACGGSKNDEKGDSSGLVTKPTDTIKQAKRGGTLKDWANIEPITFDGLTPGVATALYRTYAQLVRLKPGYQEPESAEFEGYMAESWEWSPDGLQLTLKLRPGVKFHNKPPVNGHEMTADDVVYAWGRFSSQARNRELIVNSVNPGAPILSLTSTDSRTIVIKQTEPLRDSMEFFGYYTGGGNFDIVPREADKMDLRSEVIGTGPLMLTNYTPSVGMTFKRHPEFYDQDYIYFDQADVPIIIEYAATLAQFKAGNMHFFEDIKGEDILQVKGDQPALLIYPSDLEVTTGSSGLSFGWLPEGKSPFVDERVRQAVSMALDRDLWIDTFFNVSSFQNQGMPIETAWHSHLFAVNPGWLDPKSKEFGPNAKYFQHDLAEGKKLLAAAGYPDGFETSSKLGRGGPQTAVQPYATVTDNMVSELGIKVKPEIVDYNTVYIPQLRDGYGQYEGWAYPSLAGAFDTISPLKVLGAAYWPKGGSAYKGFSINGKNDKSGDPTLTAMIEKARLEQDAERQKSLVYDIQRHLAKAMYALRQPGCASGYTMAWPALGNYKVYRGRGPMLNYKWYLDQTKAPFA